MKLIYTATKQPVLIGDRVSVDGFEFVVTSFERPHKPAASGKVNLRYALSRTTGRTFYVSIIGAQWVDREDHRAPSAIGEYLIAFDKLSLDTVVMSLSKLGYGKDEIHAALREYIDSKVPA